jgi:hypothetical protein
MWEARLKNSTSCILRVVSGYSNQQDSNQQDSNQDSNQQDSNQDSNQQDSHQQDSNQQDSSQQDRYGRHNVKLGCVVAEEKQ